MRDTKVSPGNVLYLIRAAALSIEYMNSNAIRLEFLRVARAVNFTRLLADQILRFLFILGGRLMG